MKKTLLALAALAALTTAHTLAQQPYSFYAMDTAFALPFRKDLPLSDGLDLIKRLGYDGVGWTEKGPEALAAEIKELASRNLRMFTIYCAASFKDGEITWGAHIPKLMEQLNGHCDILWLHIGGKGPAFDTLTPGTPCVAKLRELAETAKANNMKIAIYPHLGEWTEKFGDALTLAENVNHPAFGLCFNLCHALACGEEDQAPALLEKAKARLFTVTLCGANAHATGDDRLWKQLIQPLGQGTYDNAAILAKLRAIGFGGPIGFQGYGIALPSEQIVTETMAGWKKLNAEK
ncbi:MAG: sugar phosphate isomerase/epimerase [Kiritimatiellaeota bacterium]|nr:sugar phosphate isomerase/epimerase [Kiritimatiellota bacterium]